MTLTNVLLALILAVTLAGWLERSALAARLAKRCRRGVGAPLRQWAKNWKTRRRLRRQEREREGGRE